MSSELQAQTQKRPIQVPALTREDFERGDTDKLKMVSAPPGVNEKLFKACVTAGYQHFMKHSSVPTLDDIIMALPVGYTVREVGAACNTSQFRQAMLARGVDMSSRTTLTPEQDMAIAIMSAPDGRPFERKLKAAGVAPSRWRAWLKQDKFKKAWDAAGGNVLIEHENDMLVALAGQAVNGDVGAIKFALEVSGRHNPAKQGNVDATVLISQVLEIIQQEVKDIETLQRIGARMQMLGSTPGAKRVIEG